MASAYIKVVDRLREHGLNPRPYRNGVISDCPECGRRCLIVRRVEGGVDLKCDPSVLRRRFT